MTFYQWYCDLKLLFDAIGIDIGEFCAEDTDMDHYFCYYEDSYTPAEAFDEETGYYFD